MGSTGIRPVAAANAASLCVCMAKSPRLVKFPNDAAARLRYFPSLTRIPRPAPSRSQSHMWYARSMRGLIPWFWDMQWKTTPGRGVSANHPSPSPWLANIHFGAASIVTLVQVSCPGTFITAYFSSDSLRFAARASMSGWDSYGRLVVSPDFTHSLVSGCLSLITALAASRCFHPSLNRHTWCVYDHHIGTPATALSAASRRISWSIMAPVATCVPTPCSL